MKVYYSHIGRFFKRYPAAKAQPASGGIFFVSSRPGVFFDIESGLRRSCRKGLDKMLRKAVKGKIDYIITKSISRVSKDTLEVLKIIRFLRERGINMHFESEKLDSIDVDKEFEITLRSMLAQDESRNTSENIQWGFQRKFEKGDIFKKYKNFMDIPA